MNAHKLATPVSLATLVGLCLAFSGHAGTATCAEPRSRLAKGIQRFGVDGVSADATVIADLGDGWSGINGLNWQRIEPRLSQRPVYSWRTLDDIARRFMPTGRKLQVNFNPLHETALEGSRSMKVMHPSGRRIPALVRIKPGYLGNWRMMIQALVERYDHDGNGDMPGLKYPIITHIQIGSEEENIWAGATGYTEALCAAHDAARKANPEARIMAAGFNVGAFFALSQEERRLRASKQPPILRQKEAFISEFLATASPCFDILSLHLRDLEGIPGTVAWFKEKMQAHRFQKPIWSDDTMSGPALGGREASPAERSKLNELERGNAAVVDWFEREQAALLVKKAVTAFAAGVEKVFISTDADWPNYHMAIWRHMGLLDARGNRKPAFTAFKTMVEQLDGFETVRRIDSGSQLLAYEFARDDRKVYVLWSDKEGAVNLTKYLRSPNVELANLEGKRRTMKANSVMIGSSPVFLDPQ